MNTQPKLLPVRVSRGFTLLELLVVVTILAIIGGALLVAYDGLDDKASEGVSAATLTTLDSAVRTYITVERRAPDDLDSLVAADYPGSSTTPVTASNADRVQILPSKLLGTKLIGPIALTAEQFAALDAAGITHLRYVDSQGNDPNSPAAGSGGTINLTCPDADGNAAVVGPMLDIDIPHRVFEVPRPGSGRNRGRGFSGQIGVGSPVLLWNPSRSGGPGNYDNTKLKAAPDDLLVVFGLGNDATCVGAGAGRAQLSQAPVFGKVENTYEYGRYLLVFNLGPAVAPRSKATLQCVLNTHGDFADEMISEFFGQKN